MKKVLAWLINFVKSNSPLAKSIWTLIEVLLGLVVTWLTNWLAGFALPVELQAAMIAVVATLIAALKNEIAKHLGVEPDGR